ncbi:MULTISPECIES: TetR/AcrR family transcriptional regulator C-terminal domain-containing protein [Actinomadura]|uniref:TetR/AcrR family transcriptional regulator C-terminal domain-containing protein n=2 Tax=Actinomadura yumaensis TaxID=111807 RepID=A0ABW2CVK8_9ACTN|nr:TetR/AcrR family transcriptional regulator C-terminal domain-containing protein [Actinomadura sp. J1-007]MWK37713.1 TetR family transcriptional regulator [Actinomadura sp. J1-007]
MPTPPGRKPRKAAPSRRPLTQDGIVAAAVRVLDAEGLDGVTMRRVAQELDTGPASLYAHVSGKDELNELMLDRVAAEVRLPEPDPERWQEQVKEVAREVRRVWQAHADIARVSLAMVPTGANLLRIAEFQLAVMSAGGVPPAAAALAVDSLGMYVDAESVERAMYGTKLGEGASPEEQLHTFISGIRDYYKALPQDRFPHIVAMVDELTAGGGDERFEFGLDILVRGIASHARP